MTESEGFQPHAFLPKPMASAHILEAIVAPALTGRFTINEARRL